MKKSIIVVGLVSTILLVILSILFGTNLFSNQKPSSQMPRNDFKVLVKASDVKKKPIKENLSLIGEFKANDSVIIRSEVVGKITELNFSDGLGVMKGEVLLELDKAIPEAELLKAKAEFKQASDNLGRARELNAQRFLSSRSLDNAEAIFNVAKAKKILHEAKLALYSIRAPFSGVVGLRDVSVGDFVNIGQEVLLIEDISSLKFDFRLPEKYINLIEVGQEIEIHTESMGELISSTVSAFDVNVEKNGRFLLVRCFVENPFRSLKSGMFGRVEIVLNKKNDGLVISEQAVFSEQSRKFVWKIVDGKVSKIEVKTGVRLSNEVEILDGVTQGDVIVVEGQLKLRKSGQDVQIIN